tara:strand:+ start:212 stop:661 length:450 start_codon:yes stop_codon:yes gene_type:complete
MALFLLLHLGFNRPQFGAEALLVFAATAIGFCVDGLLVHSGLVHYEGLQRLAQVPLWMLALWAGFGATLRHSQHILVATPPRALLVGALGGPMAYAGGERLGPLSIEGVPGFLLIGITWALALWLLARLVDRLGREQGPQLEEASAQEQ